MREWYSDPVVRKTLLDQKPPGCLVPSEGSLPLIDDAILVLRTAGTIVAARCICYTGSDERRLLFTSASIHSTGRPVDHTINHCQVPRFSRPSKSFVLGISHSYLSTLHYPREQRELFCGKRDTKIPRASSGHGGTGASYLSHLWRLCPTLEEDIGWLYAYSGRTNSSVPQAWNNQSCRNSDISFAQFPKLDLENGFYYVSVAESSFM